jgi:Fic/DOC family
VSDALDVWLAVRPRLAQLEVKPRPLPIRGARDGYVAFLRQWVERRDPERAHALTRAHELARADAERAAALSFTLLASWQEVVLGAPAPFRDAPAFAKGGAEQYGLNPQTAARFESCLQDADSPADALALRAARAYLDVCFFHPFRDGNGRAASLLLDFVLFREGVLLEQVAPLFVVARRPTLTDARELLRLLEILLDASATR